MQVRTKLELTAAMVLIRIAVLSTMLVAVAGCSKSREETEIHASDSYNQQSGATNFDFSLRNYKHGLFLGMCASTKQLQWDYSFDLSGAGPTYINRQITILDNAASAAEAKKVYLTVVAGTVAMGRDGHTLTIAIQVEQNGIPNQFAGNGTYTF